MEFTNISEKSKQFCGKLYALDFYIGFVTSDKSNVKIHCTQVRIKFVYFDLKNSSNCMFDFLSLYLACGAGFS